MRSLNLPVEAADTCKSRHHTYRNDAADRSCGQLFVAYNLEAGTAIDVVLEPKLEHHENPDKRPVVPGVHRKMPGEQSIDHFTAHDPALLQRSERVARELAQRRIGLQPCPHGKAKSVLFLGQRSLPAGTPAAPL